MSETATPQRVPSTGPGLPPVSVSPYTASCRCCGTTLRLSDDELLASLSEPPICWPCDTARSGSG